MSKSSRKKKASAQPSTRTREKATQEAPQNASNTREAIESIVIAFVLAFLFRTFEAEAFVIPTGSMAHTLRGAHKDVDCPECGYRYQASASDEAIQLTNVWKRDLKAYESAVEEARTAYGLAPPGFQKNDAESRLIEAENALWQHRGADVMSVTCPMCRYTMSVDPAPDSVDAEDPEVQNGVDQLTYNGDRILVSKFDYQFRDPDRWDVIVFKYPANAKMNYIKRLVGLPGETVTIRNGDIFTSRDGSEPEIARKPPSKVRAMMQLVHDNRHRPLALVENEWPDRWQVWPDDQAPDDGGWQMQSAQAAPIKGNGRNIPQSFSIDGTSGDAHWIRYQHFVPSWKDWHDIRNDQFTDANRSNATPQLITDFYAYNTHVHRKRLHNAFENWPMADRLGLHWVGDLMLDCDVEVNSDQGELLLELVEAGKRFRATIDVATGQAKLSIDGVDDFSPTATTSLRGPGRYQVEMANVDDQLLLWIDGSLVEFDSDTTYDGKRVFGDPRDTRPKSTRADPGDLAPVAVGSRGASLRITGLRLSRDIYYIADETGRPGQPITDYDTAQAPIAGGGELAQFLSDPSMWSVFADRQHVKFSLGPDQFFVLGDNSPFSKDGRLWGQDSIGHYVPRDMLIGKAVYIYWPHSWGRIPYAPSWVPGWPAFGDMGLVR